MRRKMFHTCDLVMSILYYELIHMKDLLTLGGSLRNHANVARRCRDSSFANTSVRNYIWYFWSRKVSLEKLKARIDL